MLVGDGIVNNYPQLTIGVPSILTRISVCFVYILNCPRNRIKIRITPNFVTAGIGLKFLKRNYG